MAKILIAVGTTYGDAHESALVCQQVIVDQGHECRITDHIALSDWVSDPAQILLVCTSTTGMGDIPDNLMPLYCQLKDATPDLNRFRYGILGLGDSSYDCFNGAAKQVDALLAGFGAARIGEPCLIDACVDRVPENVAEKWTRGWVELIA